jgi:transposase
LSGQGHAGALDPFRHANAIRDGLPEAVTVFDAFHLVRLGIQMVDKVRRRVQQGKLGRRGSKHDPLYQIRGCSAMAAPWAQFANGGATVPAGAS